MFREREREIYFKDLAQAVVGIGKFEICSGREKDELKKLSQYNRRQKRGKEAKRLKPKH